MASVRVAVRVRPLDKRERQLSSKVIVHMNGNTTTILNKKILTNKRGDGSNDGEKIFSFDLAYDSAGGSPNFASQEKIFQDLGVDVLKAAFDGFNACVFAYGQTGTGKSYTMMGNEGDKGLIPRICESLFSKMSQQTESDAVSFRTEVSYLEIYNERVQDLLNRRSKPTDCGGLKVREHPQDGPYVENLSKHPVHNYRDVEELMTAGNGNRTIASTAMNDVSSRSHAIFTINFTQAQFHAELPCEMLSKIHLVDLAGSERADATRTTGARLKEGANINKSLVTLGSVISALADLGEGQTKKKKKLIFIPYRDSVLTWLLKDSLGGNSKTFMIATISPADVNYGETLSTLRYASRAKDIVNSPVVNEDKAVTVIRDLQAEIAKLRGLLERADNKAPHGDPSSPLKVAEKLHHKEAKILQLTKEWTNQWAETKSILKPLNCFMATHGWNAAIILRGLQEQALALRKEGSGVVLDSRLPHLIGIDEDLLCTGIILYHLKEGQTLVGCDEASCQDIVLRGRGILKEHCVFENRAGTVRLVPRMGALCSVNGVEVTHPRQLTQGTIIQLGQRRFCFNHPREAVQLREKHKNTLLSSFGPSLTDPSKSTENLPKVMLLNSGRLVDEDCVHRYEQAADVQLELKVQEPEETRGRGPQQSSKEQASGGDGVNDEGDAASITEMTRGQNGSPSQRLQPLHVENVDDGKSRKDELAAVDADSRLPSSSVHSASLKMCNTMAIPGKHPVSHCSLELNGDTLQGRVSAGDSQEQERDLSHKSGPGLTSKRLWRRAEDGVESCGGGEVCPGDASLQQTSVLGAGDGCGTGLEGNANESQGVVCEGRPDSDGTSLGGMSHLQSTGESSSSRTVPPKACAHSPPSRHSQAAYCPPEEAAFEGQFGCGVMDESRGLDEFHGERDTEASAVAKQSLGLGSLVDRVSWMVEDVRRLLWSSPTVLQQVREQGLLRAGAQWSRQALALVSGSYMLSAVMDSRVFSLVKHSQVFSLVMDSHMFSLVKNLPIIHVIQTDLTTHGIQPEEASEFTLTLAPLQDAEAIELKQDPSLVEERWSSPGSMTQETDDLKQGQSITKTFIIPEEQCFEPKNTSSAAKEHSQTTPEINSVLDRKLLNSFTRSFRQKLVEFPNALLSLQLLPLPSLVDALQAVIPTVAFHSQKTVGLYWLKATKCRQPVPCPVLLVLLESTLYTVTSDPGQTLVLFHHLSLPQLKEIQVGFAGQSLRLMGTMEESVLDLHTHSQTLTQELCRTILDLMHPGDSRTSQHPLLHRDLMEMSLNWHACIPDLLLDAGLKVCCQFQKTLADLVYVLHSHMGQDRPSLGEVQLLLYTSVRVCVSPDARADSLAWLVLTDTHLGLLQEVTAFRPAPRSATRVPRHTQLQNVTLVSRSDVRCVMVHDRGGGGGPTRLDVILARAGHRGHPGRDAKEAAPTVHGSNSSPQAEVWKLTFSCSTEAACLINHLSNV